MILPSITSFSTAGLYWRADPGTIVDTLYLHAFTSEKNGLQKVADGAVATVGDSRLLDHFHQFSYE